MDAGDLVDDDLYLLIKKRDPAYAVQPVEIGRAAWHNTGTDQGDVALLGAGGEFDSARLSSGGLDRQALVRTATGHDWRYVFAGPFIADGASYSAGVINLTLSAVAGDWNIGEAAFHGIPTGVPNDSTEISISVNGETARQFRYNNGQRIVGSELQGSQRHYFLRTGTWVITQSREQWEASAITEGVLDAERLASGGTDGQVLTRTATGQGWENSAGGAGDTFYYTIPDSDVGGTANAITLTSGSSLSAYANGQRFFFTANSTNTGALTVSVDGIAGISVQWSNGVGGSEALSGGEVTADDPITLVYGSDDNAFYLLPSLIGGAARRNVGDSEHDVAVLQSDNSFIASHLAPGGTNGQVMTRTATGKGWAVTTVLSDGTSLFGDGAGGPPANRTRRSRREQAADSGRSDGRPAPLV